MSTTTETSSLVAPAEQKRMSWVQGFSIALGVPVLILPSIGTLPGYIGSIAIVIWMFSVFQGFMQCFAYAELASRHPSVPGIPGFAQVVFGGKNSTKYGFGKFIGGFTAWGYWFTWSAVLAVFGMLTADYITALIPAFSNFQGEKWFALVVSAVIFGSLILINRVGLTSGALAGYLLAALSLIPLFIISIAALVSPEFSVDRIANEFIRPEWNWDFQGFVMLFGILATAQWSACGFEAAAIYTPLYKNPRKDIVKALFGCGIVCIFSYFLVQFACNGVLGLEGVAVLAPMHELANMTMGGVGAIVSVVMLIAAMILIIQTALLGSSSAMMSMGEEGNLPKFFGRRNSHGVPVVAMVVTSVANLCYVAIGSTSSILAAAALGYVIANGVGCLAYVKAYKTRERADDVFLAPRGWKTIALIFGLLNLPLYFIGMLYLCTNDYGWSTTLIGIVVLFLFVPLWLLSKYLSKKNNGHA